MLAIQPSRPNYAIYFGQPILRDHLSACRNLEEDQAAQIVAKTDDVLWT